MNEEKTPKVKVDTVDDVIAEFDSLKVHYVPGITHQRLQRFRSSIIDSENELESIFRLVDSHVPSLRDKTTMNYERLLMNCKSNSNKHEGYIKLLRNYVRTKCPNRNMKENISEMLEQIEEMPQEWTIVQLTPKYTSVEEFNFDNTNNETTPVHISVFNCGEKGALPIFLTVQEPRDSVNGNKIEILNEMVSVIKSNYESMTNAAGVKYFKNSKEKEEYFKRRYSVEDRLKGIVKDMQNLWLKEWRCLLIGKYVDENLDLKIRKEIKKFLKTESPNIEFSKKSLELLYYITKGSGCLQLVELRNAVKFCLPNPDDKVLQRNLSVFIRDLRDSLNIGNNGHLKRHPVILVVDEKLDLLPWEMLDVLQEQPVSRLPSLHFVYFLFKVHQKDIKNGHKIVTDYDKGAYIVNPDSNLDHMEIRIMNFINYWLPNWTGISGYKPSSDEFGELLTSSDVFVYSGHGSGNHLMQMDKLKKSNVKAVVLLIGCSSTSTTKLSPQVEMYASYYSYIIARCPCVVGMLWAVSDIDVDMLTAEFISRWIPSKAAVHWKFVDKNTWKRAHKDLVFVENKKETPAKNELELLRALCQAKKVAKYFLTSAACVVRGLPVKIEIK